MRQSPLPLISYIHFVYVALHALHSSYSVNLGNTSSINCLFYIFTSLVLLLCSWIFPTMSIRNMCEYWSYHITLFSFRISDNAMMSKNSPQSTRITSLNSKQKTMEIIIWNCICSSSILCLAIKILQGVNQIAMFVVFAQGGTNLGILDRALVS